ncbi:MAG TPA: exopolysaccharide biosynthesis protein [Alphaproteobacteria bacterium]
MDSGPPGSALPEDTIEAVLHRLCSGSTARITLGELFRGLDARAYGFLLLLLAVPNLTPGPSIPGFSTVFGVPAIVITAQLLLGRDRPWIPPWLGRATVNRHTLTRLISRARPLIRRLDRALQPRLPLLMRALGHRWVGLAGLVQALLLTLPVPLYSAAPASALLLMALGLIARDGLMLALGHIAGLGSIGLTVALGATVLRVLEI